MCVCICVCAACVEVFPITKDSSIECSLKLGLVRAQALVPSLHCSKEVGGYAVTTYTYGGSMES